MERPHVLAPEHWLGALVRVLAFTGLWFLLLVAFHSLLPLPTTGRLVLLQHAHMAAAALLAGMLLMHWWEGRSPLALGLAFSREEGGLALRGLAIGSGAVLLAAILMIAAGSLHYIADGGAPALWLSAIAGDGAVLAIAAFAEEAMFRGYGFQALARGFGAGIATFATAGAFALAHAGNPDVGGLALLNIFLAGVLLAVAYLRTLSLWFATTVHLGWNWVMASWLDLPVSGLQIFDTPLYEPIIGPPQWLAGGSFGPEAGLVGTIGFATALVVILRHPGIRPSAATLARRPLLDPLVVRP